MTPGSSIHRAPLHGCLLNSARAANRTWMAKQVPWALTLPLRPCSKESKPALLPENPRMGLATTRFHPKTSRSQPKSPTPRMRWSTRSPWGTRSHWRGKQRTTGRCGSEGECGPDHPHPVQRVAWPVDEPEDSLIHGKEQQHEPVPDTLKHSLKSSVSASASCARVVDRISSR